MLSNDMSVEGGKGAEEHVVPNCEVENATVGVLGEEDDSQSLIPFERLMLNSIRCGIPIINSIGGWLPMLIFLVRGRTRRLKMSAWFTSGT